MARRRQRGSVDDLLPENILPWAKEVWRDREELAALDGGPWMLRKAADVLGLDQGEVDKVLKNAK